MATPKVENKALRNYVYDHIRELIDQGIIPLGEKINKNEMAKSLGISQTPINDALNQLVGERFLEQRPRSGYYVREFSSKEFCELFEMRAGLETIAVRLCCENATDEQLHTLITMFDEFSEEVADELSHHYYEVDRTFHEHIIMYSNNSFILDTLRSTGFLARTYQKGLVRGPKVTMPEHKRIIEGLKKRDSQAASQAMLDHLLGSRDVFKEKLLGK
ncbi:MAG: GntR family transcriptional regulator [Sphaerochaetaceae bacterium]